MRVEIWTDIICPWCGLGNHQLNEALKRFEHANEVELIHRSFQLDETTPVGTTTDVRQMLKSKKGMTDAQVDAVTGRVEQLAAAQGLTPYVVGNNQTGNTSLAHQLAAWATAQGKGKAMWERLYQAHFGEVRSVFDVESLVSLATELGLDGQQAREVLHSKRYEKQVLEEGHEARNMGVNGVPFVLMDRRLGVSGAQSSDTFLHALQQAWDAKVEASWA